MKTISYVKRLIIAVISNIKPHILHILYPPLLEYAPDGWKTVLTGGKTGGWNATSVVTAERAKWDAFCDVIKGTGPLGFSHENSDLYANRIVPFHNIHITYGYVLGLASQKKPSLSILDYGGGLGHYYQIGKGLLNDVEIRFSCKEMPNIAEAGRILNPDIQWFTDDSCLERTYDLVMINGSLQYIENWQQFLRNIQVAVGEYLFLTRVPVVEKSDSFVAVQKAYGTQMMHWQFNKDALLQVIKDTGIKLVREVVVGDTPYIKNAPEQCELRGWLFRKSR